MDTTKPISMTETKSLILKTIEMKTLTFFLKKDGLSHEFMTAALKDGAKETNKTVKLKIQLRNDKLALYESGQLTRTNIRDNIHSFVEFSW